MKLSRQSRVLAALLAMVCVLFTQLAVAAYLCPTTQIAHVVEGAAMAAMESEHQGMAGCHETEAPVIAPTCHDHGMGGTQSLDKPELPNVAPFVASLVVQALPHFRALPPALPAPPADLLLARTTAPPISIRNCCFRI